MENALGEPQTIVLLGGTSDIGRAIVAELLSPATRTVVLAGRRPDELTPGDLARPGVTVETVAFEATDSASARRSWSADLVERHGDLDVVIVAFGQLGEQAELDDDPAAAAELVTVNFTGAVSVSLAVAAQFRRQGHGRLVVLSSVAGERVRKANYVYGATKAGLDGFAQGLGDALDGTGASVLVVRPGFVHSKMTQGRPAAPFATTPDAVAAATVKGLRAGRRTVWVPAHAAPGVQRAAPPPRTGLAPPAARLTVLSFGKVPFGPSPNDRMGGWTGGPGAGGDRRCHHARLRWVRRRDGRHVGRRRRGGGDATTGPRHHVPAEAGVPVVIADFAFDPNPVACRSAGR